MQIDAPSRSLPLRRLPGDGGGGGDCRALRRCPRVGGSAGVKTVPFHMDPFVRHCLLHGLDSIARTLEHEADIAAFESRFPSLVETTAL